MDSVVPADTEKNHPVGSTAQHSKMQKLSVSRVGSTLNTFNNNASCITAMRRIMCTSCTINNVRHQGNPVLCWLDGCGFICAAPAHLTQQDYWQDADLYHNVHCK